MMYTQIDANKRKTSLLIILFIAIILLIGWLFGEYTGRGYAPLIPAGIFSVLMTLGSYYSGDKIALAASGARRIEKNDNPYVFRMVENICITAGLSVPKVHIITDPAINAFATGRDPGHASIAVTTGAIEKLTNEELEGVIAHELSHIKNYDIRLMMIVVVLVGFIALIADWFWRMNMFGGRDRREEKGAGGILMLVGFVLIIFSPLIAELIKLAVSRKREFLADASGALLTRYPEGLASALEKIAKFNEPMRRANHATAHLFLSNPFLKAGEKVRSLFSTHPPIQERIRILRAGL